MSDAGTYDVVITNPFGSVTSLGVTVTIDPAVPPTIDQQPVSRFVYPGGTASFTVAVSGTQPMTFQWKHAGGNLEGATNATLVVTNCTATQAGAYTVSVANVAGSRVSSEATLTLRTPAAGTYEQAVVDAGPIAYWRFGETAGTTAFDYAGGHDGLVADTVAMNAAGPASPAFPGLEAGNAAYAFDGAAASVEAGSLGLPGPLSVAAWVKPNALSGDRAIAGENTSWAFKLLNNELRFTTPGILDHNSSGAALTAGEWHHVAATFEPGAADGARFYVNGRFVSSATASALTKGNSFFWVGTNQWTGQVFDGVIDEVVVYNRTLSADTIAALYAAAAYGAEKAPWITAEPASQVAVVAAPATLTVGAAGSVPLNYQWKKDGLPIPGATGSAFTIPSAAYADAGSYSVTISNAAGSIDSAPATLTVMPEPTFAYLPGDLVLHLKFDGDVADSSGRDNHGEMIGSPIFVPGKVGSQALQYNTVNAEGTFNYVTLWTPGDLAFGADVDFTVSLWVKYSGLPGDLPFISNTENSMGSAGFTICPAYNEPGLWWSLNDVDAPAAWPGVGYQGGTASVINDNQWHHIVVAFDRSGDAATYIDSALVDVRSIAGTWNVNSPYAINIGQASGAYPEDGTFQIDDVGIWRRALSSYDVLSIYNAGQDAHQSFDVYGPVKLTITPAGADLFVAWQAGTLESNTNLQNRNGWTTVQGASAPVFRVTPSPGSVFYRVRQ